MDQEEAAQQYQEKKKAFDRQEKALKVLIAVALIIGFTVAIEFIRKCEADMGTHRALDRIANVLETHI